MCILPFRNALHSFSRLNEDAQVQTLAEEDVAATCCGQGLVVCAICKEHFSLALSQLSVCPKVTLECFFPSWKPVWWSNILDCPPYAWSQLLQVTKIYPETGLFETQGLQHLATTALTAGDINKPVHSLCMCSSPAQPPHVWDRAGHCSAPINQGAAFMLCPTECTGHCCCS